MAQPQLISPQLQMWHLCAKQITRPWHREVLLFQGELLPNGEKLLSPRPVGHVSAPPARPSPAPWMHLTRKVKESIPPLISKKGNLVSTDEE